MSSMLEQAIIDAKQLRESAQKNAEETVIEKYQIEIKEAIDKILEQEDLGMDPVDDMGGEMDMGMDMGMDAEPAAEAPQGGEPQVDKMLEQLPFVQTTKNNQYIELNLTKLEEALGLEDENPTPHEDLGFELDEEIELDEDLEAFLEEDDLDEDVDVKLSDDAVKELTAALGTAATGALEESMDLDEEILEAIMALDEDDEILEEEDLEERCAAHDDVPLEEDEELEEDYGGGGHLDYGEEKKGAVAALGRQRENRMRNNKNKSLLREQKKLGSKVQLLETKLNKYGTVITKLKNKLDESNLTNAKLLYQNRVLDSVSLNERQKDKIVEAIQNANSVEGAKIIFETLQSTVGTQTKDNRRTVPDSLNEVVYRGSSAFMPRKEVKQKVDPFAERMKRLAGLKN